MRMKCLAAALIGCPWLMFAQIVSRDMGDPEGCPWKQGDWVSARGGLSVLDERAPQAPADGKTLRVTVTYPARAFAFWDAQPIDGSLPGTVKRITAWVRPNEIMNALVFRFSTTNGQTEVELGGRKQKLEIDVKQKTAGEWLRVDAEIPAVWPQPLKFAGIAAHNWGRKNQPTAETSVVDLCDVRVFTDVGAIPPDERPVSAVVQFPVHGNIFYANEDKVEASLVVGSWIGTPLKLEASARVRSADGVEKPVSIPAFACLDSAKQTFALPFTQPGAYTVTVTLKGLPQPRDFAHRYVVVLRPPKLTEEQKVWSPYALNVHSGGPVDYSRIARLGFTWIRDYAFTYDWMVRARGAGTYEGWPWYPKIIEGVTSAGLKLLPCLMGSMQAELKGGEGEVEPSDTWRRNIANIITAFPDLHAWELDNEFGMRDKNYYDVLASKRYGRYHQVFAQITRAIAPKNWVVEQGMAGFIPEITRLHVMNGDFADVDVINGHFYCGISAPEICKANANTGMSEAGRALLRDQFAAWIAAARADGKQRQVWVTEFGWDTRAGKIVTEWEQAAYLQRGYMMGLAYGINKMFWYWYDDSPEARNFFDGCGLFTPKPALEPKPVCAAFCTLRNMLPEGAKFIGYANLSPNAMAQLFEVNGKLVAAAFLIDPEKPNEGLTVRPPPCEAAYDMFGAPVPTGKRALNLAPTWYVGLPKACDWVMQTAMDVTTPHYVRSVAGEPIRIAVTDTGAYSVDTPKGWTSVPAKDGFAVTSPEGTLRGNARLLVTGKTDGAAKAMPIEVDIIPEVYVKGEAVRTDGTFQIRVTNQSATRKTHVIRAELPAGWEVAPTEASTDLAAGESATLTFRLVRSRTLAPNEKGPTPKLVAQNAKGLALDSVPVVPRTWRMPPVRKLTLDGDFSDWPDAAKMPGWMLGPRGEREEAAFYFGYAAEGLYVGVEMRDSKTFVADPKAFWTAADCLEILVGPKVHTPEDKTWSTEDRHFWICPLAAEKRAFIGSWSHWPKVDAEYDLPVRSHVQKTEGGYRMELLIPASKLGGWAPQAGKTLAFGFTTAVEGLRDPREIFWPAAKIDNVVNRPGLWGEAELSE